MRSQIFLFLSLCFSITIQAISRPHSTAYNPKIKILTHKTCVYSQALIALLDISETPYTNLDVVEHMNLLRDDKHIPKVFVNGKLIGGYQDSLKNWTKIYKSLPYEQNFASLFNPDYVISKYGTGTDRSAHFQGSNIKKM